eukprot:sb/3476300/
MSPQGIKTLSVSCSSSASSSQITLVGRDFVVDMTPTIPVWRRLVWSPSLFSTHYNTTMKIFFIATLLISVCVLDLTTGAALSEEQNPAVEMSEEQFPQYGFGVNSEEEAVLGASDTLL